MKSLITRITAIALFMPSIFLLTPAEALTNSDCVQTTSGLTLTAVASGSDCLITFTSGTGSWNVPAGALFIRMLLVGGGGGGGAGSSRAGNACNLASNGTRDGGGGGGGGGGQAFETSTYINSGQVVSISIGVGGSGGAAGACREAGGAGNNGGTTSLGSFNALGGGGGGGATNRGEGGLGGTSYDANGNSLLGGNTINAGDCSDVTTTGCFAGASGASTTSVGLSPTSAGTATDGANGVDGLSASLVSGIYGSGGGANTRHSSSSPANAARSGGIGGANAGTADIALAGGSGTANFGGGGAGGRANGWASSTLPATNAGAGGNGGSGVIVVRFAPTFSITLNKPVVSDSIYKGVNTTISFTVPVTGIVRFFVNGKRISTCKDRVTSSSPPNNVATCIWKPSVQGRSVITVQLTPTSSGYIYSNPEAVVATVLARKTKR